MGGRLHENIDESLLRFGAATQRIQEDGALDPRIDAGEISGHKLVELEKPLLLRCTRRPSAVVRHGVLRSLNTVDTRVAPITPTLSRFADVCPCRSLASGTLIIY